MPVGKIWSRLAAVPFETLVAMFAVYSGAVGLLGPGPTASVLTSKLPDWVVVVIQVGYLLAGAFVLWGVGRPSRSSEAFGLCLILGSIGIRTLVALWVVGLDRDVLNGLVLNVLTLVFVFVRLAAVVRGATIIQVEPGGPTRGGS